VPGTPAAAKAVLAALPTDAMPPQWLFELSLRGGCADELRTTDDLPPIPRTKTTPWSNQLRGYHMIARQAATFLAWEMGTGKSNPCTNIVANLDINSVLILCPTSVVGVWPREFNRHTYADDLHIVALRAGSVKKRTQLAEQAAKWCTRSGKKLILVLNYEAAWRESFAAWSLSKNWDMVICDESHRIKAPGGKASKYLAKLGARADRRVCLTGTPMPHSPLDVYAQFRFLDPGIFGTSFTSFRARYAVMGGYGGHEIRNFQNLDELHDKFYSIADRVEKTDVLDLPPFVHEERLIMLSPESRRVYDDLEALMIADVEGGTVTVSNALARLIRLQQVTSGYTVIEGEPDHRGVPEKDIIPLDADKERALVSLLGDLPADQPIIVFAKFHYDLDAIHRAAEKAGRQSVELSGRRNEIGDTWQDGEDTVAAIQIQAGGVGIDLTRASVAVYYSLGFSGGDYEQSLARCHRHGQENKVTYIHLIAEGTVDRKVHIALKRKADVVRSVLEQLVEKEK